MASRALPPEMEDRNRTQLLRSSLNDLLQKLDFIKDRWSDVGKALNVSNLTLHDLQSSSNVHSTHSPEENLEFVIVEWMNGNLIQLLLPKIMNVLMDAEFVKNDESIKSNLQKLNNVEAQAHKNAIDESAQQEQEESSSEKREEGEKEGQDELLRGEGEQAGEDEQPSEQEETEVQNELAGEDEQSEQEEEEQKEEEEQELQNEPAGEDEQGVQNDPQGGENEEEEQERERERGEVNNLEVEGRQAKCCCICCPRFCKALLNCPKNVIMRCLPSWRMVWCLFNIIIVVAAISLGVYGVTTYSDKMDELDQLFSEDTTMAKKLLNIGVREIRILVTGKTGTGKSALINGILRENMTVEGSSLDPETTEVEQFTRIVNDIPLVVFDSPGLQDGTENEKEYLLDMERRCKKVDLVLYTLKMSDKRLHADDVEAMKKLTNAFGSAFWENVVFVMTFANEIRDPETPDDDVKNRQFFEERLGKWETKLPDTLVKELNVTRKVAKLVPIIPAGYSKNPDLPGRRFWFSQFWSAVLSRMEECSKDGYSYMLHFNKDRFRRVYEVTPEDLAKDLHQQPIVITGKEFKKSSALHMIGGTVYLLSACSILFWLM